MEDGSVADGFVMVPSGAVFLWSGIGVESLVLVRWRASRQSRKAQYDAYDAFTFQFEYLYAARTLIKAVAPALTNASMRIYHTVVDLFDHALIIIASPYKHKIYDYMHALCG